MKYVILRTYAKSYVEACIDLEKKVNDFLSSNKKYDIHGGMTILCKDGTYAASQVVILR